MLSRIIKNTWGVARQVGWVQRFAVTSAKTLTSKKKKIYETQSTNPDLQSTPTKQLTPEQKKARQMCLQQLFFELGRETIQLYKSRLAVDRKAEEIAGLFFRHRARITKECHLLNPLELINYVEIIKNMSLTKLEYVELVQAAYSELHTLLAQDGQLQLVKQHFQQLWEGDSSAQTKIRSFCLIQYLDEQSRGEYLQRVSPLVKHFKTTQILMAMYEKWRFKYAYDYSFLDELHQNEIYFHLQDINLSYYKMLFLQSIKGEFIPNDDGVYNKIFHAFIDRPNVLNHSAFNKFVQMLHSQLFFLQTEFTRYQLECSLNTFVNIAKNQNYDRTVMSLDQLVQIYLGFEEINSTGQILLNQITFFSKNYNLQINHRNFPLYQKLINSVLKNIEKKIKYERRDSLNKSYTFDTINFLHQFTPKYLPLWPTLILELNHAARELFPKNELASPLLLTFQTTFKELLTNNPLTLQNTQFTLKVLRFLITYKELGQFTVSHPHLLKLLKQFQTLDKATPVSNQYLQILYLTLTLCQGKHQQHQLSKLMAKINSQVVQREINRELHNNEENNLVISLDHNIVWLGLCSAKLRLYHIATRDDMLQNFIHKKLFYLINSLQYRQVYELLVYVLSIPHIKPSVHQRLLYNLSTFIIYIDEKRAKNAPSTTASSFYLNEQYSSLYIPICKLVLEHKRIFKQVGEKQTLKVVQIMMMRNIPAFSNDNILDLLEIIGTPEFLTVSMNRYIEEIKFTVVELERYEYSSPLRSFEYYNKSISRYFEGKYSETEIKNKLNNQIMDKQEIQECFSKLQVYKTIFMDGLLLTRFDIPQPKTNITDYKCMFVCERIFRKIKQAVHLDFQDSSQPYPHSPYPHKPLNLDYEQTYIKKEILMLEDAENDFRIPNRMLPKYIKMEVWKNYSFFNKHYVIDPKDLFLNKKLTDQILNKIVKGVVHASPQKMREVLREFSCREELIQAIRDQGIEFEQHGAALQFVAAGEGQKELMLLCSNNSNYKILYICAHYLQIQGYEVGVLRPDQKVQGVVGELKRRYSAERVVGRKVQESEIQEQQQ